MTLLQQVIDDAQGTGPVAPLLRRLKVLAVRTGARDTLLPWVNRELNGYGIDDNLPVYRGPITISPTGNYIGPVNTVLNGMRVAQIDFPESMRESALFNYRMYGPVAELESCAESKWMRFSWPAEALSIFNRIISKGEASSVGSLFACIEVSYSIPRSVYVGALDQIRTAALDLALELEAVAPEAGEPDAGEGVNQKAQQVINVITTNLFGATLNGSNVVFSGGEDVKQQFALEQSANSPAAD